jgi:hypothetical protein
MLRLYWGLGAFLIVLCVDKGWERNKESRHVDWRKAEVSGAVMCLELM